jgi:hypothetical protein
MKMNEAAAQSSKLFASDSTCKRRGAIQRIAATSFGVIVAPTVLAKEIQASLIGHWPLTKDAKDYSGNDLHGAEHGIIAHGQFNGRSGYIEIPHNPRLELGHSDFSISVWVKAEKSATDGIGDVIGKWNPATRAGFTLCVKGSSGGYNSHGSQRGVHFGIDQGSVGSWQDCGRPNATSSYVSNSLTVFDGGLYAATSDANTPDQWCHVYRYASGQEWIDCGRIGNLKSRGVGPLVVHEANLYAATWNYDWTRVNKDDVDLSHVYRYLGGKEWEDIGQPGECKRLFGMASYQGKLYVVGDDLGCWTYEGNRKWSLSRKFRSLVHPMAVHNGLLYVGEFGDRVDGSLRKAEVFSFDGQAWTSVGQPMGPDDREDQIHALHTYQGKLHATTWPKGKVRSLEADGQWSFRGRLGESTESNALCVYNGKLYAGTIPGGEVYRNDGDTNWSLMKRFCPENAADPKHWGRVTSLTVFGGKMFASIGSYTSSVLDAAPDLRGHVFAYEAGQAVTYDRDLGSKWNHIAAVRKAGLLELYFNGILTASSTQANALDLSNEMPLQIGFGPTDHFFGSIRDVRLYGTALDSRQIQALAKDQPI